MHQPTEYWAKHYLISGKGCCLCGNIGIIDTTGVRTIEGELVGKKTFCLCPNGQHLRDQIENIRTGENHETETRIKESQRHGSQHQQLDVSLAHV